MFAYSQPYAAANLTPPSPYTTGVMVPPTSELKPPGYPNGVNGMLRRQEYLTKVSNDHRESFQNHQPLDITQSLLYAQIPPKLKNPSIPPPSLG